MSTFNLAPQLLSGFRAVGGCKLGSRLKNVLPAVIKDLITTACNPDMTTEPVVSIIYRQQPVEKHTTTITLTRDPKRAASTPITDATTTASLFTGERETDAAHLPPASGFIPSTPAHPSAKTDIVLQHESVLSGGQPSSSITRIPIIGDAYTQPEVNAIFYAVIAYLLFLSWFGGRRSVSKKCRKAEDTNVKTQAQLDKKEVESHDLRGQLDTAMETITDLEESVRVGQIENFSSSQLSEMLTQTVNTQAGVIAYKTDENNKLACYNDVQEQCITLMSEMINAMSGKNEELSRKNSNLQKENRGLDGKNKTLIESNKSLLGDNNALTKQVGNLQAADTDQLNDANRTISSLNKDVEAKATQTTTLKVDLATADTQLAISKEQLEDADNTISTLRKAGDVKTERVANLEVELATAKAHVVTNAQESNDTISALKEANEAKTAEVGDLQGKLATANAQIATFEEISAAHSVLGDELRNSEAKVQKLEDLKFVHIQKIKGLESNLKHCNVVIDTSVKEKAALKAEAEWFRNDLIIEWDRNADLKARVFHLEVVNSLDNETFEHTLNEMRKELADYKRGYSKTLSRAFRKQFPEEKAKFREEKKKFREEKEAFSLRVSMTKDITWGRLKIPVLVAPANISPGVSLAPLLAPVPEALNPVPVKAESCESVEFGQDDDYGSMKVKVGKRTVVKGEEEDEDEDEDEDEGHTPKSPPDDSDSNDPPPPPPPPDAGSSSSGSGSSSSPSGGSSPPSSGGSSSPASDRGTNGKPPSTNAATKDNVDANELPDGDGGVKSMRPSKIVTLPPKSYSAAEWQGFTKAKRRNIKMDNWARVHGFDASLNNRERRALGS